MNFYPLVIERDWPHLAPIMQIKLCEDTKGILAVNDEGKVVAAVVFDSWSNTSVQAHIWIENVFAIRHGLLREAARYAFEEAGCLVMIGVVPGNNAKALKFDKHIGFTEVARIKDGFDVGVDYHILEMRKEDCPWLREDMYGREESA